MRALVTGGCGFIGSHLVRRILAETEASVVNLDLVTYSADPSALEDLEGSGKYKFVKGDVCDPDAARGAVDGCDVVFHVAAETFVDRSLHRAADFARTNVLGTQVMLTAAREAGVGRFVHVSTDEVYGSQGNGPKATESSPLAPTSPYSASKAGSDLLALAAHRSFGQDVIVTRCSNNYGPRQFLEKFIPLSVTNLLDGVEVPIYGDGRQIRDWLYVTDHCDALLCVFEKGDPGEIYNIGAEQDPEWTNVEIAEALVRLTGASKELLQWVDDRPGHDRRYALSSEKIRNLGWEPAHDLESGLAATVEWYRENRWWWEGRVSSERTVPAHRHSGAAGF